MSCKTKETTKFIGEDWGFHLTIGPEDELENLTGFSYTFTVKDDKLVEKHTSQGTVIEDIIDEIFVAIPGAETALFSSGVFYAQWKITDTNGGIINSHIWEFRGINSII